MLSINSESTVSMQVIMPWQLNTALGYSGEVMHMMLIILSGDVGNTIGTM